MFIVHGTKITERKLGLVADFCPVCRTIRPFELRRIGKTSHIYYISFGSGKLVNHTIECQACGLFLVTEPLRYEKMESRRSLHDVESLVQATFPKLREVYADRLDFEERLKQSPQSITQEERAKYMLEPFRLLNPAVEVRYTKDTRFDKQSGIGCIGTLVLSFLLLFIAFQWFERSPYQEKILFATLIVAVLGSIYTVVQLGLGAGRFLRSNLLPKLARALHPLHPTDDELTAVLAKCKATELLIGKKVKVERLQAEINKAGLIL